MTSPNSDCQNPYDSEVEGDTVEDIREGYESLVSFLEEMCLYKLEKFGERIEEFNTANGTGHTFDPADAVSGMKDQMMCAFGNAFKGE